MEGRRSLNGPEAAPTEAVESDDDGPEVTVGYDIHFTVTHVLSVTAGRSVDEAPEGPAGRLDGRSPGRPVGGAARRPSPDPGPATGILEMDYKGQELAEQIFMGIIQISAVIGFILGYWVEDFGWTISIFLSGLLISCMMTIPPWPMYRQHPLKWLPVQDSRLRSQR
ncbi:signal peptidase complex subunit 1-like isoform X1 [Ornithorhynchus anatinus]|nr:signal peptidase complex subunit 1-like isoform X1 [Ornithorhynchus anatinus]